MSSVSLALPAAPHPARRFALLVLGTALLCTVVATGAARTWQPLGVLPAKGQVAPSSPVAAWTRWDSGWYAEIAERGYHYTAGQQSPVAFFPGYPLAVRAMKTVAQDVFLSGVLVSALAGFFGLLLFRQWASLLQGPEVAWQAGLLLAFYPLAFFLYGAMYGDALFLLLSVSAFLLLERGHLVFAVALAACATATRPVAPALVVGLFIRRLEWKRARGEAWGVKELLPLLAGLGFLLYILYLGQAFGEPLAFAKVQSAPGWDQAPGWRSWLKVRWIQAVFITPVLHDLPRLWGHAAITALALLGIVPTVKRLGWGYGAYVAGIIGIPALSSKDFMGMGRYVIAAFPLFLTAALLLRGRPRLFRAVLWGSASSLLVLTAGWGANWYIS